MRWHLLLLIGFAALAVSCNGAGDDDDTSSDDDTGDDDSTADDDTGDDDTGDDDTGDDDTEPPVLRGACELAEKVGAFVVQHEPEYTAVSGEVRDGVVPIAVLENVMEQGGCRLLRRNNPFCDPPCDPGETCDLHGQCIPYPASVDVGTVTITGLNKEVVMEPPGDGLPASYYDTQMPHPGFDPGAAVRLDASGNEIAGFTMYGEGFAPLESADETWIVRPDEPLVVNWTVEAGDQVTILLRFNIDQHGTTPVEIWCDVEDSGTASIPSEVMNGLIAYGVSGFPSGDAYRRSLDSVDTEAGCVEFEISSHVHGDLAVEGHIPCDSPDDCPEGMECDIPTGTCI